MGRVRDVAVCAPSRFDPIDLDRAPALGIFERVTLVEQHHVETLAASHHEADVFAQRGEGIRHDEYARPRTQVACAAHDHDREPELAPRQKMSAPDFERDGWARYEHPPSVQLVADSHADRGLADAGVAREQAPRDARHPIQTLGLIGFEFEIGVKAHISHNASSVSTVFIVSRRRQEA
jgi:hypothetical protein